jgi:hypothetical protein
MTLLVLAEPSGRGGVGFNGWTMRGHGKEWPFQATKRTNPYFGLHNNIFREREKDAILA